MKLPMYSDKNEEEDVIIWGLQKLDNCRGYNVYRYGQDIVLAPAYRESIHHGKDLIFEDEWDTLDEEIRRKALFWKLALKTGTLDEKPKIHAGPVEITGISLAKP